MTRAIAFTLVALGCGPPAVELVDTPATLASRVVWRAPVAGAHLPTDVQPVDGGAWVLDGYNRRILSVAGDGAVTPLPAAIGRAIRMTPASEGGVWLSDPEGELVRVGPDGRVAQRLPLDVPSPPVAVMELDDALIVSMRDHRVGWVDHVTGELGRTVHVDADLEPIGLVTDLVPTPTGFLAVDTSGARVHRMNALGAPTTWFGRFGLWSGALAAPRSVALGPDGTAVVVDAMLGVAQAYDGDGTSLGVLSVDGEPLRFEHPVAVRAADPHTLLILDAGVPEVVAVAFSDEDLAEARTHRGERALRARLAEPGDAADPESCLLCHDGFVNDSRQVWDAALHFHPVDVKPDRELPAFFPLRDGEVFCGTCHSPHGTSTADEVAGVAEGDDRATLVRHEAAPGDLFTRMTRQDASLCAACHGDAAHEAAMERLGFAGSAHPSGQALQDALARRPADQQVDVSGSCLGCHAPHGAADEALTRSASDGLLCLSCHPDRAGETRGHPFQAVDIAVDLPLSPHGEVTCVTCHAPVGGQGDALLRDEDGGLCVTCHEQASAAMRAPHGKLGDEPCLSCHDVHGGPRSRDLLAHAGTDGDPGACLSCHGANARYAKGAMLPGTRGHPVAGAEHDGEALTCQTCHDPHAPTWTEGDAPCMDCHDAQKTAHDAGGHGLASCLECHAPHNEPILARGDVNPRSARCLACHGPGGDARQVAAYEHPAPVFTPDGARWEPIAGLPLFGPDGALEPAGKNGDLTCSSCHWTHGPDPDKPGDSLRRAGWEAACTSCHGDEALLLYRYFHKPERRDGAEGGTR